MYTQFDFITQVKGVEYLLSISFIAGFVLFWEVLKPKPFRTVTNTGKEDMEYVRRSGGFGYVLKTAGKVAAAPFIGLAYVVMLPVMFFSALAVSTVNAGLKGVSGILSLAGKSVSFEWRPMEAYLTGKKRKQKKAETAE